MRLRKFLIAGSALAAAAALTLIPAAQASSPTGGPIRSIHVGATTSGTVAKTMVLKTASVTMPVFGSPTKLNCSAGSATGTIYPATGLPVTPPTGGHLFERFTSLTLTCDSFIPGQTVTMSVPANGCAYIGLADNNVHDGAGANTDTGEKTEKFSRVDGFFNVTGAGCVVTVTAGSCTITLGGSTPAQFDEARKGTPPPYVQDLRLKGSGLTVLSRTIGCLGAVSVGNAITMNNVIFNESNTVGYVDIRQTP